MNQHLTQQVFNSGFRPRVRVIAFTVTGLCAALLWLALVSSVQAQPLLSPTRLAQLPSGHLLVTDLQGQTVLRWNSNRQIATGAIKIPGRPVSVAFGWKKLFVGNELTQSVDVLNRGGQLQYILGGENFHIPRPSDIALDIEKGWVFVSDTAGARVLVFDQKGALLRTLPAEGQTPLYQPTGLTVDPVRGEVLVSDFGKRGGFSTTAMVRIYDYNGVYKGSISGKSSDGYGFSRPQGLAVNKQGLIYLVDSLRSQVLVFDRDTMQGVTTIGEVGKEPGQLLLPLDVLIDEKTHDLYVSNNHNRRIELFSGMGWLP